MSLPPRVVRYDLHPARTVDQVATRVREGLCAGRRVRTAWQRHRHLSR